MFIFGMILLSISAVSLIIATVFFILYRIFEYKPAMLGKVSASLKSTKYKKDKLVWGRNTYKGPIRIVMIIKHWTQGTYEYTVNNKQYKIRYVDLVVPRRMPMIVQVIYLNKFPKIAYVKTDTNFHHFEIYSFVALMFSVLLAVQGLLSFFY